MHSGRAITPRERSRRATIRRTLARLGEAIVLEAISYTICSYSLRECAPPPYRVWSPPSRHGRRGAPPRQNAVARTMRVLPAPLASLSVGQPQKKLEDIVS